MPDTDTRTELKGTVFDVQRFSLHDGPGIRTTVFFKGCPLHCAWCQNPESISSDLELLLYPDKCIGCGACLHACPLWTEKAAEEDAPEPPASWRPAKCRLCGACVEVCPTEARRMAGRTASVEGLVQECLRDKPFYRDKGGVTFSGGEPLAQWEFARALADRLRAEGVHVALDTSGLAPEGVVRQVPEHFDLVLVDLKLVTPEAHRRWTGVDNGPILAAIRLWSREMAGRIWVSLPAVPGVQDEGEMEKMAGFLASLYPRPPARVLPYHKLGSSKYRALGEEPREFEDDAEEMAERFEAILRDAGIEIIEQ